MDLLLLLVRNPGPTISKQELMAALWPAISSRRPISRSRLDAAKGGWAIHVYLFNSGQSPFPQDCIFADDRDSRLGATPGGVVWLVLRRVGLQVVLGVIVGSGVSLAGAHYIGALLYGLEPRDPRTMLTAALFMTLCAGFAGWLPARRAAHGDPATVLRQS